jgi:hypothetical protein
MNLLSEQFRLGPRTSGFCPVPEDLSVRDRIVIVGSFMLRGDWLKQHPMQGVSSIKILAVASGVFVSLL